MASRIARVLGRGGDDAAQSAARGAEEAADAGATAGQRFAEALGREVGRTPQVAANQPRAVVDAAGSTTRRAAYAVGGGTAAGGVGLGAGGALRAREQRMETEAQVEDRQAQADELQDILDNEELSDRARESALERALDSGLFDPDLGGDPDNPDGVLDNVWFRRVVALVALWYALRIARERFGGDS